MCCCVGVRAVVLWTCALLVRRAPCSLLTSRLVRADCRRTDCAHTWVSWCLATRRPQRAISHHCLNGSAMRCVVQHSRLKRAPFSASSRVRIRLFHQPARSVFVLTDSWSTISAVGLLAFLYRIGWRSVLYRQVDAVKATGNTRLWDAILTAADKLRAFAVKHPGVPRRIVVLSDGLDTQSNASVEACLQRLIDGGVVLDAIELGTDPNVDLHQLAKASGGYVFRPSTLSETVQVRFCVPFPCCPPRPVPSLASSGCHVASVASPRRCQSSGLESCPRPSPLILRHPS